ncbi:hypothetical protein COW46_02290 [Candidatus Gracilibacteria bacterium CG17_big_fil_post_rev_8_21_14_2_50_48_13]|nr:MAG: hypothetical protein COW46_02290 [Candidatus Gracilibacteria bacterium CG17_big_fil_post_rev_8_21_14_2_50_48_13]
MKEISPKAFRDLLATAKNNDVLVLDVREPHEHESGHIPDVINLPLCDIEKHLGEIKKYKSVLVHCQSGRRSEAALGILSEHGIDAAHMQGGITAWQEEGHPVKKRSKVLPIMQQVLLTAGLLVLAGTLLSALVTPWFLLLTGFVGAGLSYAGASGNCLMAKILGYMPWNKTQRTRLPWEK